MSVLVEFDADELVLTPETGFIGFADSATERYFWLQPGETSSGLSRAKDEIWLERDDQQFGGSGGDWQISLGRDSLTVDTHSLPFMACDKVVIRFEINDAKHESLNALLQTVMVECARDLCIAD